jgi:uncharacterized Ntn-hydrolase superfamily protein
MTFSLLARDARRTTLGAVTATGNLCVGGWVLRGDGRAGLTASQGKSPSTLWGEDALGLLLGGASASEAVERVVAPDAGRAYRQLAAIDCFGRTAAFDGTENHPFTGHRTGEGWIVAGNWLSSVDVISAAAQAFEAAEGGFETRLLAALRAGVGAGSDRRGTLSAALLVVGPDRPPLTLRVDYDEDPVARLTALYDRTCEPSYRDWLATLPTRDDPGKA